MGFVTILLPGLILGFVVVALAWGALRLFPGLLHPTEDAPVGTMVSGIILVFAFVLGLTVSQETQTLNKPQGAVRFCEVECGNKILTSNRVVTYVDTPISTLVSWAVN